MKAFDLHGHVAIVTGGNGGIGLGLARGLLKAGAQVSIWGRSADKNKAAQQELSAFGEVEALQVDVASESEVVAGVAATLARWKRIDSCFANAGFGEHRPFLETSLEAFERVVRGNLTSTFLTFREAAKHMVARGGGGKLIALSSIGGVDHGMPANVAYSSTKAGVTALARSLAVELARHRIQVNTIVPGWIETPATQPMLGFDKLRQAIVQRTPARRWGTPDDFEGTAVFLASAASDFLTGEVIKLDGGYTKF